MPTLVKDPKPAVWFRASHFVHRDIRKVTVVRETDAFVWVEEIGRSGGYVSHRMTVKSSDRESFHPTWAAAKEEIVRRIRERLSVLEHQAAIVEKHLKQAEALPESPDLL